MTRFRMHSISFLLATIFFFSFISPAYAALTNEQVDAVLSLLASFGVEQSVVTGVELVLRGSQDCPFLTESLYQGSTDDGTGGQVSDLQRYLRVAPVSGYFGPITEAAVKQFQSEYNVVSSGTPETTGYGVVGPKTRAKVFEICEAAKNITTNTTSPQSSDAAQQENITPSIYNVPATSQEIVAVDQSSQSFFSTVYEVGVSSGLSSLELDQVSEVFSNLAATTSEDALSEDSSSSSPELDALVSSLVDKALQEILSGAAAGASCGTPGLDFGTPKVISVTPCPCSGTVLVHMQPAPPSYVKALSYRPGSQQCSNFNIPTVGQALLGKYVPGGVCMVPSGTGCAYVPHDGLMVPGTGSSLK